MLCASLSKILRILGFFDLSILVYYLMNKEQSEWLLDLTLTDNNQDHEIVYPDWIIEIVTALNG